MHTTADSELFALRERLGELERQLAASQDASSEGNFALLIEASRHLLLSRTSRDVQQTVVQLGRRFVPADACAVWRKRSEGWSLASSAGLSEQFVRQGGLLPSEHVVLPEEPMLFDDVEHEPRLLSRLPALQEEGIRSMLAVPLQIDGIGCGTVVFYWRTPHQITTGESRTAEVLGSLAATALETAEIIERRTAELELVTDGLPAMISYVDFHQRLRRVNRAYAEFFGLRREHIIGKTIAEIAGPAHFEIAEPYIVRALTGEWVSFVSSLRAADGTMRDIEVSYSPDIGTDGRVRGMIAMINDTTERHRSEELRAHLAAIIDSSDDAIISKTLGGIITSWNRAAERIFGYKPEEAVGKHITLIIPRERFAEEDHVISHVRRGDKVDHFETERITKDGRIVTISLTVSPVRDLSGRIIGASKIARDVTHRKQLEAERVRLLEREKKARETAELLNRVGPMLSAELDPQKLTQKVTDIATLAVNAAFGAFFHNVVNERGESYLLYTLSGVSREAFQNFPMPRNTGIFGPTFAGEGPVRSDDIRKDPRYGKNPPYHGMPPGHLPVCSYLAVPVISRNGSVLGGLFFGHPECAVFTEEAEQIAAGIAAQAAIALDNAALFTGAQLSQDALRKSNEELQRVNDDLSQFAHSASHDLQEPLRTVSIYSQLLERKLASSLNSDTEQYLKYIVKGASRMEALVRDLLAYTEASHISSDPAPVIEADQALDAALSNLSAAISDAGASVTRDPLPRVKIPQVHLTQVFQNVIGNAIKYRSDQPPQLTIRAKPCEQHCVFSVEDNGIGIEPQYKEQIFGIFKRLHTADAYSGTGIGLAICQRILERAGGRIWVESQPGRGSTFFFQLPSGE